jgi:betaine/carnitine transporter, BCCT family
MSTGNLLLCFCVVVALSPLGKIRLGGKGASPDYSRLSWFAMLFGAGMGIGLVFYGVGEPVTHFTTSMAGGSGAPLGGAVGDADVARGLAMAATIFDWGLHPWAIFTVTGLALAVFSFDYKMPLSMRSAFYPLFGKAVWGRAGAWRPAGDGRHQLSLWRGQFLRHDIGAYRCHGRDHLSFGARRY